jgi:6-phosphogluconolactonase (cycloisomerase 2 family)
MHSRRPYFTLVPLLSAVILIGLLAISEQTGWAEDDAGVVYVMTNQPSGNSVMVFHRGANGNLSFVGSVASGGNGTGTGADPLGSQGALTLSRHHPLLFAVNAGSDSLSLFAASGDELKLLDTAASHGTMPVSVTAKGRLVYVLNAGGTPNISGFTVDPRTKRLVPLAGSTRNLPGGAGAGPAQVSFTPDGSFLVVTEKNTNTIDTFAVEHQIAQPGVSFPSNGTTPFGFSFGRDDVAIVSDAAGGPGGTSALSSYEVERNGNLELISPALGDTQLAACWVVVPGNGRFAYTANTGSNTISSYKVAQDGSLTLLNAQAALTGSGSVPVDMALSTYSRFLYVRGGGNGAVEGFRIHPDGSLTPVTRVSGVPSGAQGIAAR